MLEQTIANEREHDALLALRKSVDELADQLKELNQKLPKLYEIEDLVKSVHKLAHLADTKLASY